MVFIKEQKENHNCYYKAHVWFHKNHSIQCGCFTMKEAAEKWAYWLEKRILTDDLFKATHKRQKHL